MGPERSQGDWATVTRAQEEELDELRNGSHEIQVSFGHQLEGCTTSPWTPWRHNWTERDRMPCKSKKRITKKAQLQPGRPRAEVASTKIGTFRQSGFHASFAKGAFPTIRKLQHGHRRLFLSAVCLGLCTTVSQARMRGAPESESLLTSREALPRSRMPRSRMRGAPSCEASESFLTSGEYYAPRR